MPCHVILPEALKCCIALFLCGYTVNQNNCNTFFGNNFVISALDFYSLKAALLCIA